MVEPRATNLAGGAFDPGAYWELLEQDGDLIQEDRIDGETFHDPTAPKGEAKPVKKRNNSHQFDRFVFTGKAHIPKLWCNGEIARDPKGNTIFEINPHTNTVPDIRFCRKHNLNLDSHPVDWFTDFVPVKNKRHDTVKSFTVENQLYWTNARAQMKNAGLGGK